MLIIKQKHCTSNVAHDAGQETFAAFKIYGNSNIDNSVIQLKIFGGTRGVTLTSGGKYYIPDSLYQFQKRSSTTGTQRKTETATVKNILEIFFSVLS